MFGSACSSASLKCSESFGCPFTREGLFLAVNPARLETSDHTRWLYHLNMFDAMARFRKKNENLKWSAGDISLHDNMIASTDTFTLVWLYTIAIRSLHLNLVCNGPVSCKANCWAWRYSALLAMVKQNMIAA